MLTDWTTDDGLLAIETMGWPEWTDDAGHNRVLRRVETRPNGDYFIADPAPDYSRPCVMEGHYEALAILRDWAREWLIANDVAISTATDCLSGVEFRAHWMDNLDRLTDSVADYDLALISAVLAVGDKP